MFEKFLFLAYILCSTYHTGYIFQKTYLEKLEEIILLKE